MIWYDFKKEVIKEGVMSNIEWAQDQEIDGYITCLKRLSIVQIVVNFLREDVLP